MSNILLSEQNKELLWNILSTNKVFANIPESKFYNVKVIFESNVSKIFNENKDIFTSNYKTGDSKNVIMQLNKTVLQNIMLDINAFKKSLLPPLHIKDTYKNDKSEEFEKELLEKKESFSNFNTTKFPEANDFSETKDSPLENNNINELLERIQRERNNIIPILNPNPNPNSNSNKLELVDLNKFDTPLLNEENINRVEKEDENSATKKSKILNIEDLINDLSSPATMTTTTNARELSRENNTTKKFIVNENNGEFNLNIKLDFLNKQLEKVLYNQKLIMAKLSI
jgi:hypothetical protein